MSITRTTAGATDAQSVARTGTAAGAVDRPGGGTADSPAVTERLYRRISRRELHSPRSLLAIVLAVLIVLLFVYAGVEIVLNMLGQPALVASPSQVATAIGAADTYPTGAVLVVGSITALVGIVLIVIALTGGRRARHLLVDDRAAVVVDNEVIASALARFAARAADVDPDNTSVTVTHRRARVDITPTSGQPVDATAVLQVVTTKLAAIELRPAVTATVHISRSGKVGA
ncbi:hypothetical protein [Subtercola sp. YIM 133946]|uniref:hypothetical protein n=1 Tax=Subtercola sp. YIM 133946 TaxID=3118909 RepID=UPI002F936B4C